MKNESFSPNETIFLEKVLSEGYLNGLKESAKNRFGFTDDLI